MNKHFLTLLLLFSTHLLWSQLTTVVDGVDSPGGLAFFGDELYISEVNGSRISVINVLDSNPIPETVASGIMFPREMVIYQDELYFAQSGANRLSKINITSSDPQVENVIYDLDHPFGLVRDGSMIYVTERDAGRISKIDLDTNPPTISEVVSGLQLPLGIVLYDNSLYVAEYDADKISKVDLLDPTPTATDVVNVNWPIGLLAAGNELFISSGNEIVKIPLTDPNPTPMLVTDLVDAPTQMAARGPDLYISEFYEDRISKLENVLSVPELPSVNTIKLFPNPASEIIQIKGLTNQSSYHIRDMLGTEIRSGEIQDRGSIDIQNLSDGLYLLQLDNGTTLKFLKE